MYPAWEPACARHKALSVVEEAGLEMKLHAEWAEEAIMDAARAWQEPKAPWWGCPTNDLTYMHTNADGKLRLAPRLK